MCVVCFFKQKTAYEMRISDWGSDVCSSDLRIKRFKVPPPAAGAALADSGDTEAGNAADRLRVEACQPGEVPPAFGVVAIGTVAGCTGRQQDDAFAGERGARLPDGIGQVRRPLQREAGRARPWGQLGRA